MSIAPREPGAPAVKVACPACRSPLVLSVARPPTGTPALPLPAVGLTARESEVAGLFATGLRPRQIARRLGVSVHTARAHVKAIMRKLDVHSQARYSTRSTEPRTPLQPPTRLAHRPARMRTTASARIVRENKGSRR